MTSGRSSRAAARSRRRRRVAALDGDEVALARRRLARRAVTQRGRGGAPLSCSGVAPRRGRSRPGIRACPVDELVEHGSLAAHLTIPSRDMDAPSRPGRAPSPSWNSARTPRLRARPVIAPSCSANAVDGLLTGPARRSPSRAAVTEPRGVRGVPRAPTTPTTAQARRCSPRSWADGAGAARTFWWPTAVGAGYEDYDRESFTAPFLGAAPSGSRLDVDVSQRLRRVHGGRRGRRRRLMLNRGLAASSCTCLSLRHATTSARCPTTSPSRLRRRAPSSPAPRPLVAHAPPRRRRSGCGRAFTAHRSRVEAAFRQGRRDAAAERLPSTAPAAPIAGLLSRPRKLWSDS